MQKFFSKIMKGFVSYLELMKDLEQKRIEQNLVREWYKRRIELAFKQIKVPKLKNN